MPDPSIYDPCSELQLFFSHSGRPLDVSKLCSVAIYLLWEDWWKKERKKGYISSGKERLKLMPACLLGHMITNVIFG